MADKEWYVADFETTSYKYYLQNGYTKVWLYAVCDKDANITAIGTSIEDFIHYLRSLVGKTIYFHNLKFDGEFIISYLLSSGYEYTDDLPHVKKGFSVLIGEMGEFYGIDIKFSTNRNVHLKDSLKLLPFKVSKIAKDFGLPILKLDLDYENYTVDEKAIEYISHDVRIIAMALSQIKQEGMNKMTTASCAYSQYSSMISDDFARQAFPNLDDDFLEEWRQAYRGGRSQVNPYYQEKLLHNVKRFDINSMYPAIMYNEELPYGLPVEIKEIGSANFELYKVFICFSLKAGHLPCLLKKASLFSLDDSYYVETDGVECIWLSSIDYELVKKHYDIQFIEFQKMYGFRTTSYMFRSYVSKWYERKSHDVGAKKVVDKLMLNSLYGKFGSKHRGFHKIPFMDEETGVVKYKHSELEDMKKYYLPIAIAITSYAHKYIDDAICETGIENFVYCDTDSIHTLGTLPKDMIDNKKLGKFKLEAIETKSKYVRQKTYVYKENDEIKITCAGMSQDMKDNLINTYGEKVFDMFKKGLLVGGKLMPKHVPGGVVLYETTFKIKL